MTLLQVIGIGAIFTIIFIKLILLDEEIQKLKRRK